MLNDLCVPTWGTPIWLPQHLIYIKRAPSFIPKMATNLAQPHHYNGHVGARMVAPNIYKKIPK